jgi:hypothetical protein
MLGITHEHASISQVEKPAHETDGLSCCHQPLHLEQRQVYYTSTFTNSHLHTFYFSKMLEALDSYN